MGVEQILSPLRPVLLVCRLGVESHGSREQLRDEEHNKASAESRLTGGRGFTLNAFSL